MDNNADPLIDQGGEQAYNDALQYVEGAVSYTHLNISNLLEIGWPT